uniref:Immunoglobulin V-set domain-containing protein n=1 Tax=Nothobranchius furzeri TaxID=105023 RepID=A0A8C6PHD4_NOTFU
KVLKSYFWVLRSASPIQMSSPSLEKNVQIFCTHDKTDHTLMLWYQRTPGDTAMKLIGYLLYKAVTMEDQYKDGFDLTGDATKNGSLHINTARSVQTAVYFCAASKAQ